MPPSTAISRRFDGVRKNHATFEAMKKTSIEAPRTSGPSLHLGQMHWEDEGGSEPPRGPDCHDICVAGVFAPDAVAEIAGVVELRAVDLDAVVGEVDRPGIDGRPAGAEGIDLAVIVGDTRSAELRLGGRLVERKAG